MEKERNKYKMGSVYCVCFHCDERDRESKIVTKKMKKRRMRKLKLQ